VQLDLRSRQITSTSPAGALIALSLNVATWAAVTPHATLTVSAQLASAHAQLATLEMATLAPDPVTCAGMPPVSSGHRI